MDKKDKKIKTLQIVLAFSIAMLVLAGITQFFRVRYFGDDSNSDEAKQQGTYFVLNIGDR